MLAYMEEGIFRISGSHADMLALRKQYDARIHVDFSQIKEPHLPAGLLKLFLRELPETLLTKALLPDFTAAVSTSYNPILFIFLFTTISLFPNMDVLQWFVLIITLFPNIDITDVLQRFTRLSAAIAKLPKLNKRVLHEVFSLIAYVFFRFHS